MSETSLRAKNSAMLKYLINILPRNSFSVFYTEPMEHVMEGWRENWTKVLRPLQRRCVGIGEDWYLYEVYGYKPPGSGKGYDAFMLLYHSPHGQYGMLPIYRDPKEADLVESLLTRFYKSLQTDAKVQSALAYVKDVIDARRSRGQHPTV